MRSFLKLTLIVLNMAYSKQNAVTVSTLIHLNIDRFMAEFIVVWLTYEESPIFGEGIVSIHTTLKCIGQPIGFERYLAHPHLPFLFRSTQPTALP